MHRIIASAAIVPAVLTAGVSAGQVFSDLTAFQTATPTATVLNDFNALPGGTPGSLSFDYGSFAYEISAANGLVVGPSLAAPFLPAGTVSTLNRNDPLVITFSGPKEVRAVGGDFWGTGLLGAPRLSKITINLSNGDSAMFTTLGPEFRGFVSDIAIVSMTIEADRAIGSGDWFATMDNFRVAVVPLPPAAWAGLATLGLAGGVRAWRRR